MKNVKKTKKNPDYDVTEKKKLQLLFLKPRQKHMYCNIKMVSTENQNITVIYHVGKVGETDPKISNF